MAHHIHTLAVARQTRAFITACLRADTSSKQQAIWGLDLSRVAGTLPVSMAALMVGAAAADIQEVILEDNMVVTITVNMEEATAATVVVMAVDTVVAMADMEVLIIMHTQNLAGQAYFIHQILYQCTATMADMEWEAMAWEVMAWEVMAWEVMAWEVMEWADTVRWAWAGMDGLECIRQPQ
ncbi:hypothetical protein IWW41_004252, partial [Coemansia sp. RSA 2522]